MNKNNVNYLKHNREIFINYYKFYNSANLTENDQPFQYIHRHPAF